MPKRTEKPRLVAIAEAILSESSEPLHSMQIIRLAVKKQAMKSEAAKPDHSLQAAIWRNIRTLGDKSPFVLLGTGRHRKYWLRSKLKPSDTPGV